MAPGIFLMEVTPGTIRGGEDGQADDRNDDEREGDSASRGHRPLLDLGELSFGIERTFGQKELARFPER